MSIPPLSFRWDGEAMAPRFPRIADRHFVIGQDYLLVEHHDRSQDSHRHYFACIREAWQNLPEDQASRWPTAEHLRKWGLIRAGYRDERVIVCANNQEAMKAATFASEVADYAVVTVVDAVVTIHTAKSQSVRAMGREEFQASKDAVLTALADLIGVSPDDLSQARAA